MSTTSMNLFVASRDDGMIGVFRGDSLELIDSIRLELGVNRIVYDPAKKYLYFGCGAKLAGFDYGRVGILDARSDKLLGDIIAEAHPSQILLDTAAHRIFASVWQLGRIDVFDAIDHQMLYTQTTGGQSGDMAIDRAHHRLFMATRNAPQATIVYDSDSGQEIARLPAEGRMWKEVDPDHYESIGRIQGGVHGKTSLLVPELKRYYVAVSEHQDVIRKIQGGKVEEAYIEVYEVEP